MTDVDGQYERLAAAVAGDGADAAVCVEAVYRPALPGSKIAPPTFPPPKGRVGSRYVFEKRRVGDAVRDVVVIDSIASQANRVEVALEAVADSARLPVVEVFATFGDETARVTSWSAPHRQADAYFEHSVLDGVPYWDSDEGRAAFVARPENASALLRWFPGALVFGSWTSRKKGRHSRFPRVYTSEIVGLDPIEGERLGMRTDPLNLQRPPGTTITGEKKLADIGFGMIPAGGQPGGVSVSEARRWATLSLTGLRRLSFGGSDADAAGRVLLAALALWGDRLAFAAPALWLRSGCDLILDSESVAWLRQGGERDPWPLDIASARAVFETARERAAKAGVELAAEVRRLTPNARLRAAMEFTLTRAEPVEEST